jgi:hypothetical protein
MPQLFEMIAVQPNYHVDAREDDFWNDIYWFQSNAPTRVTDRLVLQIFRLGRHISGRQLVVDDAADLEDIRSSIENLWIEFEAEALWGAVVCEPAEATYSDAWTALSTAYFAAARMLLSFTGLHLLRGVGLVVADLSQTILNCASFLAVSSIGCACLRMFFPITLVALHGASSSQRARAQSFLDNWLRETAFGGLTMIANQRIQLHNSSPIVEAPA